MIQYWAWNILNLLFSNFKWVIGQFTGLEAVLEGKQANGSLFRSKIGAVGGTEHQVQAPDIHQTQEVGIDRRTDRV